MVKSSVITNYKFKERELKDFVTRPTLSIVLNEYLRSSPSYLNMLTGFFNPKVWRLVGDQLSKLPKAEGDHFAYRMVIGREVSKFDPQELQRRFAEELADAAFELAPYIRNLIYFLKRDDTGVRLLKHPFMHGKLYLFPKIAIVGSSNFTISGLERNHELNLITKNTTDVNELHYWFEYYWSKGEEYKKTLFKILNESWLGLHPWTPYEVYTKIAFEYYKQDLGGKLTGASFDLVAFQKEGVVRALNIIKKQKGVLIADAVGLGKTFTGLETAFQLLRNVKKIQPRLLIICPAQLKPMWTYFLEQKNIHPDIFTMEMLSRKVPKAKYDVLLIDECHNFRRSTTKRYNNLQLLLGRNIDVKLILLSATPINTDMMDLYHQIRLITREVDTTDSLKLSGIDQLREYFKALISDEADFQLLKEAFLVCRSRAEIRFRQEVLHLDISLPDGTIIRFPQRKLDSLEYSIVDSTSGSTSGEFYSKIDDLLSKLTFPQFNWEKYHLPEFKIDKQAYYQGEAVKYMIHALFLKRLESSLHSFLISINAQISLLSIFLAVFKEGYAITTPIMRMLIDGEDEIDYNEELDDNVLIDFLMINYEKKEVLEQKFKRKKRGRINPAEFRIDDLEREIISDLEVWKELRKSVKNIIEQPDRKLLELTRKLKEILAENSLKSPADPRSKVLLFSYFRDTAEYIERKINDTESPYFVPNCVIEIITGGTPTKDRLKKVYAFAPLSNPPDERDKSPEVTSQKNIDILISTDVLSEGQNLQDANHVINYDLHWNPVRMIQRAGRIDRLKSPHSTSVITIHNFFVEDGLEELLGLMDRLTERLDSIDQTIELDGAILRPTEAIQRNNNLKRIKNGDISVWDEYEAKIELSDVNPTKKTLQEEINKLGLEILSKRPYGIHSGRLTEREPGLIVAMQIEFQEGGIERRWVFDPDHPEKFEGFLKGELVMTRREVENMLRCKPNDPRVLLETEDLFPRVKQIRDKILGYLEEERLVKDSASRYVTGSRKYARYIIRCIKEKSLDRNFCQPFLNYAHKYSIDTIKADISGAINRLNEGWKVLEERRKQAGRNDRIKREIVKDRGNLVKEFLEAVYAYFEEHAIDPSEFTITRIKNLRLVGFLRLLNPDQVAVRSNI